MSNIDSFVVQYSTAPNCNGTCKFCLIRQNEFYNKEQMLTSLNAIIDNIKFISTQPENWTNKYADGISILGGESYYITDKWYKDKFLELVDVAIEYVLKKSPSFRCKFSSVTNGNYDPNNLLYPTVDKIVNSVGIRYVDINFSYDFNYRFNSKEQEKRVRDNINDFHKRYNYGVGIQMVLTDEVLDKFLDGWNPDKWIDENFPGCQISFLYPHKINRGLNYNNGKELDHFWFTRSKFLKFLDRLSVDNPIVLQRLYSSVEHSGVYKYTGLYTKTDMNPTETPRLSDGKEIINQNCNHSELYKCYKDSDKCILCDLESYIV